MFRGLWLKFFTLLLITVSISLAAAFTLRQLMIRDFRAYEEGQIEDRVYWVVASLESSYEKNSSWDRDASGRDAAQALMMGLDIRLFDARHVLVTDTELALKNLPPLIRKKVLAISSPDTNRKSGRFFPYPLFLNGKEIGSLEVRFPQPQRESIFIRRSGWFLLFAVIVLGGIAFALSILFSRRLTRPLKGLAAAAEGVIEGKFSRNGINVSGRDEVARLSAAFNRLIKFLETQETLRKKLTGNVSHEIRTPLTAIRGELAGMIDGLIPVDGQQLQSLYEETWRLEGLLDGIEELSRAQAGAVFLHRKLVKARPLLENIKKTFSGISLDKGVSLEVLCDDELDLYCNPERLSQIMINLVSNALKAVGKDGKVALRAGKNGKDTILEIEDNGSGIGADCLPFIFERFYRSSEGGIGIGLAIAKELVEAHEGRIEVNSEEGKGTLFRVVIPDGEGKSGAGAST